MKLDDLWSELEAEARQITEDGILKRLLNSNSACTMYAGVQRPSLNRLFLMQAPRILFPSKEHMPELRGFDLNVHVTGEEPETHATIILSANDPVFNEVFSVMLVNLYESLQSCSSERQAMHTFLQKLGQWREFFERNSINGLSEMAQRGLYGELYFLKKFILTKEDYFISGILGWTGSKNRQHDFQFGDIALEVKTCITKQHQKMQIANEQQLDETLVAYLYLFHLSLSVIESHVNTLPAIITDIREMIQSVYGALSHFESALMERGYLDIHNDLYLPRGYAVREENIFRVVDGFPRLTERDLPIGVGDLSYSISVAECKKFTAPFDEVIEHIRRNTK
ncbi:PD-(D/E)XK motif protein [Dyadobacter sp. Leaf189]|uniref:PD-(D/E)XK motif protein n=1 Tax=Dyadobacter sp. Leaf189 TaxID=1736295 RepID=UPI000AE1D791|nr:PD-(D/E)XK motif protein [Dyadobacter sp. Leaf189]